MKDINGRNLNVTDICVIVDCDTEYLKQYHYFDIGQIVQITVKRQALGYCNNAGMLTQMIKPEHVEFMSKF